MRTKISAVLLTVFVSTFAAGAGADELRVSTLAGASLVIIDRDTEINPYDFGRNPAWILSDMEYSYIRFFSGLEEISGNLRRNYDPGLQTDLYAGFQGIKKLGERHAARGRFDYRRLWQRDVYHSLEKDQYNDPFYLTDLNKGNFEYYGPTTSVDYAYRISDRIFLGGGFDYEIDTGLKQEYTRPELVHNYFRGNLGVVWEANEKYQFGMIYRPTRLQNKTYFDDTDEGIDNLIHAYIGDGIYETRNFGSYTVAEVMYGHEAVAQIFRRGEAIKAGLTAAYSFGENDVTFGSSTQYKKFHWEENRFDIQMKGRWTGESPLSVGASARYFHADGWATRPEISNNVIVYETPFSFIEAGIGGAYTFKASDLTLAAEYHVRLYDAKVSDYSGGFHRESTVTTNTGKVSLEKRFLNVYSIRTGFEYIDYPVDRWLKLPQNIDIMKFTAGGGYYIRGWEIDLHLEYEDWSKDDLDVGRRGLGAIVWFTKIVE
ncbi:MAG: hypothetical protein JW814_11945 [Candidatus Krumholzibacteriota bacterium]|nr:hypothetical protein [Candidatus Krumholzibacteriota bacterium]